MPYRRERCPALPSSTPAMHWPTQRHVLWTLRRSTAGVAAWCVAAAVSAAVSVAVSTIVFVAVCLGSATSAAAAAPGWTVTEAVAVESDAPHFPVDPGSRAAVVHLPDDWAATRPHYSGGVWYRASFAAQLSDPAREVLALGIGRACGSLLVDLNGVRVARSDLPAELSDRGCHRPQRILLPAALLRADGNWLDVHVDGAAAERVASRSDAAGMSAWQVGPQADVSAWQQRQYFWHIQLVQLCATALLTLGAVLLGLGWLHGRDARLLWYGGFCCGWAVLAARIWLQASPFDAALTDRLLTAAGAPVVAMAVRFLLELAGQRPRQVDAVLIAQCALLPASLWLAGADHLAATSLTWDLLFVVEVGAAAVWALRALARRRPASRTPLAGLFAAAAGVVILEAALDRAPDFLPPFSLLHTVLPLLLLVIGALLLRAYAAALRSAEEGRHSLESRVQQITEEIERNFAQLAELRVEQVTDKERKRIAADLHDDLGAKLLTIVHTSESDRISALAREALEEMRLSVRGLTSKPVRLVDALADWRAEIVSRLGQANIDTDWSGPPDDTDNVLPARNYVQTTRILREAVSNIIKHSGASHCKVRVLVHEQDFVVTVQDNGRGIPLEIDGRLDRGHGMSSMKHRAKQLRGQCLVESGPGYGTVIRVTLPL